MGMNLLLPGKTEMDYISDAPRLVDAVPTFADFFDGIQDERSRLEEISKISAVRRAYGMTDQQTMMRVACIPPAVIAALVLVNPSFGKDKREFYAWLERNPWYRVGRTVVY